MLNPLRKLVLAASLGAGIASFVSVASALPVLDALAIKNAAPPTLEEVQWRGRWGWGWGWGAPVAAGVVVGALVGGALAAPARLRPYYSGPYYPGPAPAITAIRRRHLAIRRRHLPPAILRRRPAMRARRFRGRPSGLLHAAIPII